MKQQYCNVADWQSVDLGLTLKTADACLWFWIKASTLKYEKDSCHTPQCSCLSAEPCSEHLVWESVSLQIWAYCTMALLQHFGYRSQACNISKILDFRLETWWDRWNCRGFQKAQPPHIKWFFSQRSHKQFPLNLLLPDTWTHALKDRESCQCTVWSSHMWPQKKTFISCVCLQQLLKKHSFLCK